MKVRLHMRQRALPETSPRGLIVSERSNRIAKNISTLRSPACRAHGNSGAKDYGEGTPGRRHQVRRTNPNANRNIVTISPVLHLSMKTSQLHIGLHNKECCSLSSPVMTKSGLAYRHTRQSGS